MMMIPIIIPVFYKLLFLEITMRKIKGKKNKKKIKNLNASMSLEMKIVSKNIVS